METKNHIPGTREFNEAVADVLKRYDVHNAPFLKNTDDSVFAELSSRKDLTETRTLHGSLQGDGSWAWKLWYSEPWYAHKSAVYGAAVEIAFDLPGTRSAFMPVIIGTRLSTMHTCSVCGSWIDLVAIEHGWVETHHANGTVAETGKCAD